MAYNDGPKYKTIILTYIIHTLYTFQLRHVPCLEKSNFC